MAKIVSKPRACKNCRYITNEQKCPNCGSDSLSKDWSGYIIIVDPKNSEIAKALKIEKEGKYAVKVK